MSGSSAAPSRRRFLRGAGIGAAAALAGGCSAGSSGPAAGYAAAAAVEDPPVVDTGGDRQPGVDRPAHPQRHVRLRVADVVDRSGLGALLTRVGSAAAALADGSHAALAGMAPARLTSTVGLGPAAVTALDGRLPGRTDLPAFPGDAVPPTATGGDLMLQVCSDDAVVLSRAVAALLAAAGPGVRPRWSQDGFRGAGGADGSARNLLGFADGVIVPRGEDALRREVWLDAPAGATIAVVRRLRLDVAGFSGQPVAVQEAAVGRRRDTAEPLSGGPPGGEVDLGAKTPDGQFLVPVSAHARRAHPSLSGSGLMLRRGYSFDNGVTADGRPDAGTLFICFQRELRTFVATQYRLSEDDALLRFATTTASGTFLVLPAARLRA